MNILNSFSNTGCLNLRWPAELNILISVSLKIRKFRWHVNIKKVTQLFG